MPSPESFLSFNRSFLAPVAAQFLRHELVYLTWKTGEATPEPVATIWDHKTGETVRLYKFPDAEHPLPVIPSLKDMKVCPMTRDKEFTSMRVGNYD